MDFLLILFSLASFITDSWRPKSAVAFSWNNNVVNEAKRTESTLCVYVLQQSYINLICIIIFNLKKRRKRRRNENGNVMKSHDLMAYYCCPQGAVVILLPPPLEKERERCPTVCVCVMTSHSVPFVQFFFQFLWQVKQVKEQFNNSAPHTPPYSNAWKFQS